MTNLYRALSPAAVAAYADGVFEWDFTVVDELDALDRGVLELVPRPYRVLSSNYTIQGWMVPQDAVVTASFPIEIEAALVAGGHIVREDEPPAVKSKKS